MANSNRIALQGSDTNPMPGARAIGSTDPHQLIEISVLLKHRQRLGNVRLAGRFMNHSEFAAQCGADPTHVDKMRQFAQNNNLKMLERGDEVLRRTVTLAGTVAQMEKAFGVELNECEYPDGSYRGRTGPVQIPQDCEDIIQGVFGLDNRAVAKPQFRYRSNNRSFGTRPTNNSFSPAELGKAYNFPQGATGNNQVIALIELGGGFRPADIQAYFQSLGLPAPIIKTAAVNHAKNRPSTAQSADGQVMLDIEIAGALAPGATIVVYFAPNTSRGFQDALSMAVHDQLRGPRVISIGWGASENSWTRQSMECFDQVAQEAALLGITVIAACGDNGSSDGMNDGQNHVNFPASSPYVLACGGTQVVTANGAIQQETLWNAGTTGGSSGGGYSQVFDRPAWQANASSNTKRGVPDVCANADPETGYDVLVDGERMVVGGTSAAAALWAALTAVLCEKTQTRMGLLNPALYNCNQSNCFGHIASGNNGAYSVTRGWNPASGLGSPQGTQLLQVQQATATERQSDVSQTHQQNAVQTQGSAQTGREKQGQTSASH